MSIQIPIIGELLYYIPKGTYTVNIQAEKSDIKDRIEIIPHSSYNREIFGLPYESEYVIPLNSVTCCDYTFTIKTCGSMLVYKSLHEYNRGTITITPVDRSKLEKWTLITLVSAASFYLASKVVGFYRK